MKSLRAIAFDIDGVLTDGSMYYTEQGDTMKKFNTKDGMGISMLIGRGLKIAFISGENSQVILKRAEKLGVTDVYIGVTNKMEAINNFLTKYKISIDEAAYVGDDLNDTEVMKAVGVSFAVNDAVEDVKKVALVITEKKGGQGAVREIADAILKLI